MRRALGSQGHPWGQVQKAVAGEGELGKEKEVDALAAGPRDPFEVVLYIRLHLSQTGVDLSQSDRQLGTFATSGASGASGHGRGDASMLFHAASVPEVARS